MTDKIHNFGDTKKYKDLRKAKVSCGYVCRLVCMDFIMDQAMMENYKFVWHVPDTYIIVNHIFVIKKKCIVTIVRGNLEQIHHEQMTRQVVFNVDVVEYIME